MHSESGDPVPQDLGTLSISGLFVAALAKRPCVKLQWRLLMEAVCALLAGVHQGVPQGGKPASIRSALRLRV